MQRRHAPRVVVVLGSLLCLGFLSQTACKKKDSASDNRPSLLVPGELDEMRKTFTAIAAENAAKSCKRPVLRGPAREGRADTDMLALLADDGVMSPCYSALKELEVSLAGGGDILEWLREIELKAKDKGEQAELIKAKESIADLQEACSIMAAPLSNAVSHEDACSPYLPGRLGQGKLLPFIVLSKAVVLVSRNLALNGKELSAVQLLLDTLRFGQDLSRGGTSLIEPMLAYASHRMIRPELSLRFDKLSLDELRVVEGELALLIESQPHHSEYFEGERNSIALHMVWPALEANDWQPPGGYPEGQTGSPIESEVEEGGPTAEETAMLMWVLAEERAQLQETLCNKSVSLRSCATALDSQKEKQAEKPIMDVATVLKMVTASDAESRSTVRKLMLDILRSIAEPDLSKYFLRIEAMRIVLVAQHNKIQSLIASKTKNPCPAAFVSMDEDAAPRVVPQDGQWHLYLPQWLVDRAKPGPEKDKASELLITVLCP